MPNQIDRAELTTEAEVELYEELKRYAQEAEMNGYHELQISNAMRNVAVDMVEEFKRGAVAVGETEIEREASE